MNRPVDISWKRFFGMTLAMSIYPLMTYLIPRVNLGIEGFKVILAQILGIISPILITWDSHGTGFGHFRPRKNMRCLGCILSALAPDCLLRPTKWWFLLMHEDFFCNRSWIREFYLNSLNLRFLWFLELMIDLYLCNHYGSHKSLKFASYGMP